MLRFLPGSSRDPQEGVGDVEGQQFSRIQSVEAPFDALVRFSLGLDNLTQTLTEGIKLLISSSNQWVALLRALSFPELALADMARADLERSGKGLMCKGRVYIIESHALTPKSAANGNNLHKWRQAIPATLEPEARRHLAHKNDFMLRSRISVGPGSAENCVAQIQVPSAFWWHALWRPLNTGHRSGKTSLCHISVIYYYSGVYLIASKGRLQWRPGWPTGHRWDSFHALVKMKRLKISTGILSTSVRLGPAIKAPHGCIGVPTITRENSVREKAHEYLGEQKRLQEVFADMHISWIKNLLSTWQATTYADWQATKTKRRHGFKVAELASSANRSTSHYYKKHTSRVPRLAKWRDNMQLDGVTNRNKTADSYLFGHQVMDAQAE